MCLLNFIPGKKWQDKVLELRKKMNEKNAGVMVVTALDDVAWLLNLRGSDIQYNPVFFSYVIVTLDAVLYVFISSFCSV